MEEVAFPGTLTWAERDGLSSNVSTVLPVPTGCHWAGPGEAT